MSIRLRRSWAQSASEAMPANGSARSKDATNLARELLQEAA